MKRYIITQPKEQGIYCRYDDVFTQINIKDILTNTLSDPSSVSVSIIDPKGTIVVSGSSMTKLSTGVYDYDYSIPSDSCYGIYRIEVKTLTENTITNFNFVLFPWDVISQIRGISGFFQQNDISDYKLALLAWSAFEETLDQIYDCHYDESLRCTCYSNDIFNGVNVTFHLKHYPLADFNGDEQITGFGELTCGEDVTFHYIDNAGVNQIGHVKVIDADVGVVELKTISDAPVPSNIRRAYVSYCERSEFYNQELMHEAVAYLAAHKALVSFQSLGKATLADLQSNEERLRIDKDRFLKRFEELISQIGIPNIGAGN